MNMLQTNFRCCRHFISNVIQIKKLSDKSGKSSSSSLFGYPVGVDLKDLDSGKVDKFAEVYRSTQEQLGKDFHLRAKADAHHYLAKSEKTVKIRKLLEKTEEEVKQAIDLIDSFDRKPELKRDFIQIGLRSVVNQLHSLSKQYEQLQKETDS